MEAESPKELKSPKSHKKAKGTRRLVRKMSKLGAWLTRQVSDVDDEVFVAGSASKNEESVVPPESEGSDNLPPEMGLLGVEETDLGK